MLLSVEPGNVENKLNLVQPNTSPSQQNGSSVSLLARDILPIHTRAKDFESGDFNNIDNNDSGKQHFLLLV